MRLAWWPAHSTGRYGGSVWYLDQHAMDFAKNCVMHMNCDSPGCRWATEYTSITMMPETVKSVTQVVERVTGQTPKPKRPNRSSDYTFYNIGVSGAFMASSMMPKSEVEKRGWHHVGGCGGNIAWHTEDDTFEIADKGVLKKDVELYLEAVVTFANAEILPLDFRASVHEISDGGRRLSQGRGHALRSLRRERSARKARRPGSRRSTRRSTAGKIAPRVANDTMRDLSRALVPLNYALRGPHLQDPAVTLPPVPLLSIAADLDVFDKDTIGFALATLLRGRNAALAAIDAAGMAIERASGR